MAQARLDPEFAKDQIILLFAPMECPTARFRPANTTFPILNPPVLACAAWRIYKVAAGRGGGDRFLARVFHKHLLNFNWWVNRKDIHGSTFPGGFLGLDNIGGFDRSRPLPQGVFLEKPMAPPGWACIAPPCWPWRWSWPAKIRLRRHRLQILRTLRRHRRRLE